MAIGAAVGRAARAGDLVALIGQLGAGKTQFVRGLARGLGVDPAAISSPTFVVVQEHEASGEGESVEKGAAGEGGGGSDAMAGAKPQAGRDRPRLVHIDAYRLERLEDLESIGWSIDGDTLGGEMREGAVVAIEWADRLAELAGEDRLEIELAHAGDEQRDVMVTAKGAWVERFDALRAALESAVANHAAHADAAQTDVTAHDSSQLEPAKETDIANHTRKDDKGNGDAASTNTRPCPICEKPADMNADTFPFCSSRCRNIDLGKWLGEGYVISRTMEQSDLEMED